MSFTQILYVVYVLHNTTELLGMGLMNPNDRNSNITKNGKNKFGHGQRERYIISCGNEWYFQFLFLFTFYSINLALLFHLQFIYLNKLTRIFAPSISSPLHDITIESKIESIECLNHYLHLDITFNNVTYFTQ